MLAPLLIARPFDFSEIRSHGELRAVLVRNAKRALASIGPLRHRLLESLGHLFFGRRILSMDTSANVGSPTMTPPAPRSDASAPARVEQTGPIIETRNLSKTYRDFWGREKVRALKALDLEIHRGE